MRRRKNIVGRAWPTTSLPERPVVVDDGSLTIDRRDDAVQQQHNPAGWPIFAKVGSSLRIYKRSSASNDAGRAVQIPSLPRMGWGPPNRTFRPSLRVPELVALSPPWPGARCGTRLFEYRHGNTSIDPRSFPGWLPYTQSLRSSPIRVIGFILLLLSFGWMVVEFVLTRRISFAATSAARLTLSSRRTSIAALPPVFDASPSSGATFCVKHVAPCKACPRAPPI